MTRELLLIGSLVAVEGCRYLNLPVGEHGRRSMPRSSRDDALELRYREWQLQRLSAERLPGHIARDIATQLAERIADDLPRTNWVRQVLQNRDIQVTVRCGDLGVLADESGEREVRALARSTLSRLRDNPSFSRTFAVIVPPDERSVESRAAPPAAPAGPRDPESPPDSTCLLHFKLVELERVRDTAWIAIVIARPAGSSDAIGSWHIMESGTP